MLARVSVRGRRQRWRAAQNLGDPADKITNHHVSPTGHDRDDKTSSNGRANTSPTFQTWSRSRLIAAAPRAMFETRRDTCAVVPRGSCNTVAQHMPHPSRKERPDPAAGAAKQLDSQLNSRPEDQKSPEAHRPREI
ncbi:hypothetical protein MFM001_42810 [Mycobacterium sp. MFM001]|nr:hypothetical protein MFM001_42810 [Mycobacterium sp. MFM001]